MGTPRQTLAFEPASGRFGRDVSFIARRGGYALGLMNDGSTVLSSGRSRVTTKLIGVRRHPAVHPESRLPGVVNSYVGSDRTKWRTGLATYGAVRYEGVLPGIDLRYHGTQGQLEYDYIVEPGADTRRIRMGISGTRPPKLTRSGDLVIPTPAGALRQRRPVAYQEIDGARVHVPAAFDVDGRRVSFRIGDYDTRRPLVIDPQLLFSTYLGGTGADSATEVELVQTNGASSLIVGGTTKSPSFHGSNQNADGGFVTDDVWLSKMTGDGTAILVTTFIGGTSNDSLTGMTVGTGRLYVTGGASAGMPVGASLVTPFDSTYNAGDSWVARVSPTDLVPEVVTYFPGPTGAGIAYSNFTVFVAGSTSTGGLATGGAYDTAPTGTDAFAASLNASLTTRNWATYLGSSAEDIARTMTVDSDSNVILAGYSVAPSDFPVTAGSNTGANLEGFLSKLSPDGTALSFSRLYGGADYDLFNTVWVQGNTTAVLGGETASTSLPGIGGPTPPAGFNGFVIALSLNSLTTTGGAFLGGGGSDSVTDIAVDGFAGTYILGTTDSTDFPTVNPVQSQKAGGTDVFLVKRSGSTTVFSTYLGGTGNESAGGLAADPGTPDEAHVPGKLRAYAVGGTGSTNFAATAVPSEDAPEVVQPDNAGGSDAFVVRIQPFSAKITGGPAEGSTVASSTANFILGPALETGASFNCSLDGAAYEVCSSTTPSFPALADGAHTLRVRYHDVTGLTDGTVALRSWTVDTTPPLVFALQSPADGAIVVSKPTFSWDATTDARSMPVTYELWVDGAPRSEDPACDNGLCSASLASALSDGAHTWQVRATDAVGNVRSSATRTAVVDAAGPSAAALTGPADGAELVTDKPELTWSAATDNGSGLAEYDIELDGRALGLRLGASTLSFTPSDPLAEGAHDWRVIATDQFGNSTSSGARKFRVDLTPPSAQLTASPNPVLPGRTVTLDASASSDAAGGRIVHYEWDLDGDGAFEVDGGTTPTITKTFGTPGTYLLAARVTDPVGRTRVVATTLFVTSPPTPQGQLGVTINNGAQYTRSADVTLNLKFPSTTTQLLASNDGGFLAPATFAPKQEISWKLDSSGPERLPKTVYVRFLLSGIVSETYTDDIILDETPPVVEQATVAPATAAAVRAAKLQTFTVKVKATDSNSGVNAVQITAKKSKPGKFLKYKTTLKVKATSRKLYVRARDRAGNLSAWKKAR